MKNHPNTENQLVTENENLTRLAESVVRENSKLRSALASITGQLEGEAEYIVERGNTNLIEAIQIYRQLIRLHKASPLGRVSRAWVKEWNDKLEHCYDLLDETGQGIEAYPSR